jgi:hypothetical protein
MENCQFLIVEAMVHEVRIAARGDDADTADVALVPDAGVFGQASYGTIDLTPNTIGAAWAARDKVGPDLSEIENGTRCEPDL